MAHDPVQERAVRRLTDIHHVYVWEAGPQRHKSSIHQLFQGVCEEACSALGNRPAMTAQHDQRSHTFAVVPLPPLPPPDEPPPPELAKAAQLALSSPALATEEQLAEHRHLKQCLELAALAHVLITATGMDVDCLMSELRQNRLQADTTLEAYREVPHEVHEAMQARFGVASHAVAVEMANALIKFEFGSWRRNFAHMIDRDQELGSRKSIPPEQWRRPFQNVGLRGYNASRQLQSRHLRPSPY